MRQVAEAVGVATSTVSKALRNDPSISAERCREIRAAAEQLGYRPNPMVATLMAQLHQGRRRADPHQIAWIDLWQTAVSRGVMKPEPLLRGARQRAAELGYGIEVYRPAKDGISPERLRQMLTARGQWGLVFPAVPESAMRYPFDLRGFAAVTIGSSLHEPVMHRVSQNHFQGCVLAFERLRERGFRRIGMALSPEINERVEGKWLGAFLFCQHRLPASERVAPRIAAPEDEAGFVRWAREEKLDAVLVAEKPLLQDRNTARRGVPGKPMLFSIKGTEETPNEEGLDYRPELLGSIAVETVVAQIHRNERGSPAFPHTIIIDPVWVEEKKRTARKRTS